MKVKPAFEAAITTAKQIDDFSERNDTLRAIAMEQAGYGFFDDAITTANMMEEWYRSYAFESISTKQVEAGLLKDAYFSAYEMGTRERAGMMSVIAEKQIELGLFDDALVSAKEINNDFTYGLGYTHICDIAEKQAYAGLYNKAFDTVNLLFGCDRDRTLKTIVVYLIEKSDSIGLAQRTSELISDNYYKSIALAIIAEYQAVTGNIREAKITFNKAETIAQSIVNVWKFCSLGAKPNRSLIDFALNYDYRAEAIEYIAALKSRAGLK